MIALDALIGARESCAQTEGGPANDSDRWGILEELENEIAHASSPSIALSLMNQLMALRERKNLLTQLHRTQCEYSSQNEHVTGEELEINESQARAEELRQRAQAALFM